MALPLIPLLLAGSALGVLWLTRFGTPAPPIERPPPPKNQTFTVTPQTVGSVNALVGDIVMVTGLVPYSPTNPSGLAIYTAPGAIAFLDATETSFKILKPGDVHLAWGGGPTGDVREAYFNVAEPGAANSQQPTANSEQRTANGQTRMSGIFDPLLDPVFDTSSAFSPFLPAGIVTSAIDAARRGISPTPDGTAPGDSTPLFGPQAMYPQPAPMQRSARQIPGSAAYVPGYQPPPPPLPDAWVDIEGPTPIGLGPEGVPLYVAPPPGQRAAAAARAALTPTISGWPFRASSQLSVNQRSAARRVR